MATTRSEKDSMGSIDVPANQLWGAQTQRSLAHFRISQENANRANSCIGSDQRAAAQVNMDLGLLPAERAKAIMRAADEVLDGAHPTEFPLAIWQTGRVLRRI